MHKGVNETIIQPLARFPDDFDTSSPFIAHKLQLQRSYSRLKARLDSACAMSLFAGEIAAKSHYHSRVCANAQRCWCFYICLFAYYA
jgi:hypothetical protein